MYKLLELSAVWFEEGDRLGQLLALVSLAPLLIFTSQLVIALCTDPPHSRHHLALLLGQLLNEAVSLSLKRLFKMPRPQNGPPISEGHDDFGMPSRHAQFMGFLVGYWRAELPGVMAGCSGRWLRVAAAVVGFLVCWSRCYLRYHSVEQVLVGAAVGFLFARAYKRLL